SSTSARVASPRTQACSYRSGSVQRCCVAVAMPFPLRLRPRNASGVDDVREPVEHRVPPGEVARRIDRFEAGRLGVGEGEARAVAVALELPACDRPRIGAEGVLEEERRIDAQHRVMGDQRHIPGLGDDRLDQLGWARRTDAEVAARGEIELYLSLAEPLRDPLRTGDRVPHLVDRVWQPALEAQRVAPVGLFDGAVVGDGAAGRGPRPGYSLSVVPGPPGSLAGRPGAAGRPGPHPPDRRGPA